VVSFTLSRKWNTNSQTVHVYTELHSNKKSQNNKTQKTKLLCSHQRMVEKTWKVWIMQSPCLILVLRRIDPLPGNDSVNTFPRGPTRKNRTSTGQQKTVFSVGSARGHRTESSKGAVSCQMLKQFSWSRVELLRNGLNFGDDSIEWSRRNGKKGIRLWKEDSTCDLKWQWDCYKSVARIRLVKAGNPSACITVNCEM
jgi:hypothetical protein